MDASLVIRLVDQLTGPAKKVRDSLQGIGEAAKEMKAGFATAIKQGFSIDNIEEATKRAEQRLNQSRQRLLGAAAMGAALLAPAKMASDFSASMSNVSTLIDTTAESMADMKNQVLDMGDRVPVALDDLTGSLYDIRSAGISAGDAMNVLEGSARLAVAGLGDSKEATDLVTSSINAFNLKGEEQARIYDIIFKAVKNGKTTISGLSQGFGAVAGTVANAHVKIDEYMASVAALTTTGMPAAQAHTQIRTAIVGLTRDTKETSAVFKQLHVKNFKELVDKSGGMVAAFGKIRDTLKGDDAAMQALFGSAEAVNAVLGLTGAQAGVFNTALDDMRNGANAVDEAFAKQAAEADARFQMLQNQLRHVSIAIGTELLPVLIDVVKAVGPIIHDVIAWTQANPDLAQGIILATAAVLGLNIAMRLLSFGIDSIRLPMIGLAKTFLRFNAEGRNVAVGWRIMAGAGRLLGLAFSGIVAGGGAVLTFLAGVSAPVWAVVGALIAAAFAVWKYWDRISSFMSGFLAPFGDLITEAAGVFGDGIDWILDKFSAITGLDTSGARAAIASFFDFSGLLDGAREMLDGFWDWFKGFFSAEKLSDDQKAGFEGSGRAIGQALVDGIKAAAEALWEWFASWPALIKEKIGSIDLSGIFKKPEWLDKVLGYFGSDDQSPPSAPATSIGPPLQGLNPSPGGGTGSGWFSNLFGGIETKAADVGEGLASGGERGGEAVAKGGRDAAEQLRQAAREIGAAAGDLRRASASAPRTSAGTGLPSARNGTLYDGGSD